MYDIKNEIRIYVPLSPCFVLEISIALVLKRTLKFDAAQYFVYAAYSHLMTQRAFHSETLWHQDEAKLLSVFPRHDSPNA